MNFTFNNKRIAGIISILPENTYFMEDEIVNPEDKKTQRLKRIIGYGARKRVKGTTTLSDMLLYGVRHLLDSGKIKRDEIGAIVVATLSQDYVMPTISAIMQGEMEFGKDTFCIDIPQACGGFTVGLIESFLLLDHMPMNKKVLLCTGDTLNRRANENEPKREHPTFGGDIANITLIENVDKNEEIYCSFFNDGSQRQALMIPHGGFRSPMTHELLDARISNLPCSKIEMDGSAVFNFVQKELPEAINELCKTANINIDEIDWFFFHQPNRYMLEKLASVLGVPVEKMPMKLTQELGNSNSGTIPAVITTYAASAMLEQNDKKCCLSGFGAGLTWASVILSMGNLDFCENLDSDL